jgi:hypothetical protein
MRIPIVFLSFLFLASKTIAQTVAKRLISPEDIYRMKTVGSPKISPDGN